MISGLGFIEGQRAIQAIDGTGGRKHQVPDASAAETLKNVKKALHVGLYIDIRIDQ